MTEYISREAAIEAMYKDAEAHPGHTFWTSQYEALRNIPAADVRPVVRGKWIMNDECRTVCSLCGNVVAFVAHQGRRWAFGNFCPNCGADMREES